MAQLELHDLLPERNDPSRAGQHATAKYLFGPFNRYAVFAVHTRFDAVSWFVTDAEQFDDVTGAPLVIRQEATRQLAVRGLPLPCAVESGAAESLWDCLCAQCATLRRAAR
jgi:hypothetical protein